MSKAATIDALVESAIHHFAKCGYEGASLRDIARNADVPLSTIHLYFGSKWDLFHAATTKAWNELDRERHALLENALAAAGDEPAPLEGLIHALAYPTVRRALSKDAREQAQVFMMHTLWRHFLDTTMMGVADKSMSAWVDAMARACPDLTRQDVIWAFSYVVGVV